MKNALFFILLFCTANAGHFTMVNASANPIYFRIDRTFYPSGTTHDMTFGVPAWGTLTIDFPRSFNVDDGQTQLSLSARDLTYAVLASAYLGDHYTGQGGSATYFGYINQIQYTRSEEPTGLEAYNYKSQLETFMYGFTFGCVFEIMALMWRLWKKTAESAIPHD